MKVKLNDGKVAEVSESYANRLIAKRQAVLEVKTKKTEAKKEAAAEPVGETVGA